MFYTKDLLQASILYIYFDFTFVLNASLCTSGRFRYGKRGNIQFIHLLKSTDRPLYLESLKNPL